MPDLTTTFDTALDAAFAAVAAVPDDLATAKAFDDRALVGAQSRLGQLKRQIDLRSALLAGEISFRSRRDLGYSGLAQKEGFQTAEKLIQHTTGSTRREATTLVNVGAIVHEANIRGTADPITGETPEGFVLREPWLVAVGTAVSAGSIPVEAANAIKNGLGAPTPIDPDANPDAAAPGVTVEMLQDAVHVLLEMAPDLDADALFRQARQLRDELDEAGIAERERIIYEQRAFRRTKRPNGQSRFTLDPDIETSAYLDDLYDKLISPRRGGPRFVDPADQAWAESIVNDPRTTEQYLHDAMVGLIRKGVDTDLMEADELAVPVSLVAVGDRNHGGGDQRTGAGDRRTGAGHQRGSAGDDSGGSGGTGRRSTLRIVGSRPPAVRVLVTEEALATRTGHGRIEGVETPVSIETVERIVCTAGTVPIAFGENGNVIDLGRESRLFTSRQKTALAARDGGCMWDNCDAPARWTEAHHINQWARDHGLTNLADGILLCRHHHMLLHNNHWSIVREGDTYWLIPPTDLDPEQTPRRLRSKSAALRDLQRERRRKSREHQSREQRHPQARDTGLGLAHTRQGPIPEPIQVSTRNPDADQDPARSSEGSFVKSPVSAFARRSAQNSAQNSAYNSAQDSTHDRSPTPTLGRASPAPPLAVLDHG